jgi:hypothetical protein
MAHLLTKRTLRLVFPLASVVFLGAVATAAAQSAVAESRANGQSAVASGTANGAAAIQNSEKNRASNARATGRSAALRNASDASAAPVALALEDAGPGPSSTPEPLSVMLIGGALAGLYGLRKHLS